jgi:hypothetical protein
VHKTSPHTYDINSLTYRKEQLLESWPPKKQPTQ